MKAAGMKAGIFSAVFFGVALGAVAIAQNANPAPAAPPQTPGAGPDGGQGWRQNGGGPGFGRSGMGSGRGVQGTVTAVGADHYTVKTEAGEVYTVQFSTNTRIMKQPAQRPMRGQGADTGGGGMPAPQQLKPADIKIGDPIAAIGEVNPTAKSVGAVVVFLVDPERAKMMREMQANYGKTWLQGKVTAIDGVKVTVLGAIDNAPHTFVADENTTFRKRRDPITLAEVQVGDMMRVEGAIKDGTFLASSVAVMGMRPGVESTVPQGNAAPPPGAQPK